MPRSLIFFQKLHESPIFLNTHFLFKVRGLNSQLLTFVEWHEVNFQYRKLNWIFNSVAGYNKPYQITLSTNKGNVRRTMSVEHECCPFSALASLSNNFRQKSFARFHFKVNKRFGDCHKIRKKLISSFRIGNCYAICVYNRNNLYV